MRKQPKPPMTQRSFANLWGELEYLCKKTSYWLYIRSHRIRAERYLDRLNGVISRFPENELAIIRQEGLALLYELKGEISEAIVHRKREIQLMERLHRDAQSAEYSGGTRAYVLRDRDAAVLQERRAILEALKQKAQNELLAAHARPTATNHTARVVRRPARTGPKHQRGK